MIIITEKSGLLPSCFLFLIYSCLAWGWKTCFCCIYCLFFGVFYSLESIFTSLLPFTAFSGHLNALFAILVSLLISFTFLFTLSHFSLSFFLHYGFCTFFIQVLLHSNENIKEFFSTFC